MATDHTPGRAPTSDEGWRERGEGSVLAIRHLAFEDLGTLGALCAERGLAVRYADAGTADFASIDALEDDLVVVLGGPIGAGDDADYPFLADEARLVEKRLQAGRPVLGICLGAQIIARALGARVYPATAKEIGWAPVALSEAGLQSPLSPLSADVDVLHWHGDTFDLPDGARLLASTDICANQAFDLNQGSALAVQFHLETPPDAVESWLIGHTVEIAATENASVAEIRAQTQRQSAAANAARTRCLADWLDGLSSAETTGD